MPFSETPKGKTGRNVVDQTGDLFLMLQTQTDFLLFEISGSHCGE
jgi:hypothetical protein